jgi:hypothetical protein
VVRNSSTIESNYHIYTYQTESTIIALSATSTNQSTATENAVCHLRIFQDKTATIIIMTELATNPGMSITNAAEGLTSKIVKQFHLNPQTTRFIEHYGQESYELEEGRDHVDTFDEVTFSWQGKHATNPEWRPAHTEEITNLLTATKRKAAAIN